MTRWVQLWKKRAQQLKSETYTLYLAYRDPRVPWVAKVLAACVVAYAFSPIDLIPDFVPVLGYLDDLLLVPLGIALVIKMVPPDVMQECRTQAQDHLASDRPINWVAGGIVLAIWLVLAIVTLRLGLAALALVRN